VTVLPTHGFGSFCAAGVATGVETSIVEEQRLRNLAFRSGGEDAFVAALLGSLTAYPGYFERMPARNLEGPSAPDLSPPLALNEAQLRAAVRSAAWVVDLRPRASFAWAHLHRSVNIEHGVQFTTYLGWLLPAHAPLVLMAETEETVARAQFDLTRIGIDHVAGRYVCHRPPVSRELDMRSYPVRRFVDLAEVRYRPGIVTLDVRRDEEWDDGHLNGAIHMPLHHLVEHSGELPSGTVWVHCAAGFRAGIAASLLAREGRNVVLIDDNYAATVQADHHPSEDRVPTGELPHASSTRLVRMSL
jgi:rhodanese-related sulfurtransferase